MIGPYYENNVNDTFDLLWKTVDEKYPLLEVKNINWDSLYLVYHSKITPATTEDGLWKISCELLSSLDDGHVALCGKKYNKIYSPSRIYLRSIDDFSLNVAKTYLSSIKTTAYGYITYGNVKNKNIGYIYLSTFQDGPTGEDWGHDIDKVIEELYDCDAIILDVRNNGGGLLVNVQIIASAFIDRDITYFYSRLKTGPGHYDLSDPIAKTVSKRTKIIPYTKKVGLLTNRYSGSGSESTAQIFKFVDYAIQIGDTTFGAIGEINHEAELPNGWTLRYPCTLYTTPEGFCPEGIGIVPDIQVENTKADIESGHDKVMEYAIEYFSK